MAYTTPTTRVTGEVITSGDWNADVTDNIKWLAADKPMCRVYRSSTQTIGSDLSPFPTDLTTLTFNSESYDNYSMHSTSSDTSRITIPVAGRYMVGWRATTVDALMSDPWQIIGFIRLNGDDSLLMAPATEGGPASGVITTMAAIGQVDTYQFAANDYIEVRLGQFNGAASNLGFGHASVNGRQNVFWAHWLST